MEMETKTLKIQWNGTEAEVQIKRLTFGEKNDIQEQAVKIRVIGNSTQATVSNKVLKEVSLTTAIVKAPFEHKIIDEIRNLPADIGDYLFEEINKFNTLDTIKKSDSNMPLEKEQETQD